MLLNLVWLACVYVVLPYILYHRLYKPYCAWWHYYSQKAHVKHVGFPLPFIGNLVQIVRGYNNENKHPFNKILENAKTAEGYTKTSMIFAFRDPWLVLNDVKIAEQLFTTYNQHFDKYPMVQIVTNQFLGNSLLFGSNSKEHKFKRKAMSPAFYRGKLQDLIATTRRHVLDVTIPNLRSKCEKGPVEVDIINEVTTMITSIIFKCTMGLDVTEHSIQFWENGKARKTHFSYAVRECFTRAIDRLLTFHVCMWPEIFTDWHVTQSERDLKRNFLEVRQFVLNTWLDRKHNKEAAKAGEDLISVMQQEPLFFDNDELAVNEILTIIFAGSQTSANATQNLIMHLCKHPEYKQRILDDNEELTFYQMCFNEALRMQPPVYTSSPIIMTKDLNVNGLKIRKDDCIFIHLAAMAKDPSQWQRPNEFLPDRFDPNHPLFLTPSGVKRNPFAFSPFLAGHRICLGKTFIEEVSKETLPALLRVFDFGMENASSFKMPFNNMQQQHQPVVMVKVSARD